MTRNRIILRLLFMMLAAASVGTAQGLSSGEGQVYRAGRLLTNDSIVRLTQADVSQETILHAVNTQPGSYALGVDDIIAFKQAGVSDRVLDAILDHSAFGCGPAMTVPMELFVSAPSVGNGPGQPPGQPVPTPHSSPSKSASSTAASAALQGNQAPVYHYGTVARKAPQSAQ